MFKADGLQLVLKSQGWCDVRRKKSATKCDCDGAIFKSSSQNSEKCGIYLNSLSGLCLSEQDSKLNHGSIMVPSRFIYGSFMVHLWFI